MNENELVKVGAYYNNFDASMAKTMLEDAGIECFLEGENINSIYPAISMYNAGVQLFVNEEDAENALEILNVKNEEN